MENGITKPSGIKWIGDIPSNWQVLRVKDGFFQKKSKALQEDPVVLTLARSGVKIRDMSNAEGQFAASYYEYNPVTIDDMLLNPMDLISGDNCSLSKVEGVISPAYVNLRYKKGFYPAYYQYYFKYQYWSMAFFAHGKGVSFENRWTLNNETLMKFPLIAPPFEVQKSIADFLDQKCSEIDTLVADIQSQIETLEQYKRSLITETVTKGLNSGVAMKETGIEWLGKIPAHWNVKKGKYCFVQKSDKGNSKSLTLLSPTQNYGVIPQELYEQLSGFSTVKLNEKTNFNLLKTVHKGAYVISLRSFQGGFEYSEYEGVVSPAYQVFYPTIPISDYYYKYLFKTQIFIDKINSYTMSLRDGKPIAFADFGKTYIPIPPKDEQEEITNFLNIKCSEIDTAIEEKRRQLETLDSYKKSLIYEYVTGKKQVKENA